MRLICYSYYDIDHNVDRVELVDWTEEDLRSGIELIDHYFFVDAHDNA